MCFIIFGNFQATKKDISAQKRINSFFLSDIGYLFNSIWYIILYIILHNKKAYIEQLLRTSHHYIASLIDG